MKIPIFHKRETINEVVGVTGYAIKYFDTN